VVKTQIGLPDKDRRQFGDNKKIFSKNSAKQFLEKSFSNVGVVILNSDNYAYATETKFKLKALKTVVFCTTFL